MNFNEKQKLTRSNDRVFAGVAGGIAEYFNISKILARFLFLVFTIWTHGMGLLLYIILIIFMPSQKQIPHQFNGNSNNKSDSSHRKEVKDAHESDIKD